MIQLSKIEFFDLKSQIVTSRWGRLRKLPSIFEAFRQLMAPPEKPKRQIGFLVEEPKAIYRTRRRKV